MQALQAASQRILSPTLIAMKNGIYSSRIIQQQLQCKVAQTRLVTTAATATTTAAAISSRNSSRVFLFAPFVSFIVFEAMFVVASQDSDVTSTWRRHNHRHRYQIMLNKKPWQSNTNSNKHFTV